MLPRKLSWQWYDQVRRGNNCCTAHWDCPCGCDRVLYKLNIISKFKVASIFVTNEAFPRCANFHSPNAINEPKISGEIIIPSQFILVHLRLYCFRLSLSISVKLDPFRSFLVRFGPFRSVSVHLDPTPSVYLGLSWSIMVRFGPFRFVLVRFGSF